MRGEPDRPIRTERNRASWGDLYLKGFLLYSRGLYRIWRDAGRGGMLISASRREREPQENQRTHEDLKDLVRFFGLAFFDLDGHVVENEGTPKETKAEEPSLFVPFRPDVMSFDEFLDLAQELLVAFTPPQDGALVIRPEGLGGGFYELTPSSMRLVEKGHMTLDRVTEAYSRLAKGAHAGRQFVLSGFRMPLNSVSACALRSQGYLWP